jgi:hypothetical protein
MFFHSCAEGRQGFCVQGLPGSQDGHPTDWIGHDSAGTSALPFLQGQWQCDCGQDKCTSCHGEKTVKEKKTLEVHINKGMKHGEKIVFRGEADEAVSHNKQAAPMPCPSLFFFYFLFPSEALR